MRILFYSLLLSVSLQHLRNFETLEHFLENSANHLPKEQHKQCFKDLEQVYASNKKTHQICNKEGSYMLILLNPALEKHFEKLNQKNPGFARIAKYVKTQVAGQSFIVMLMYSSFGFTEDYEAKYQVFKKVVSEYSPLTILDSAKNLILNYSNAFGENYVFVGKEYQKMCELHFYKFAMKGKKDQEGRFKKKAEKELKSVVKAESKKNNWSDEQFEAEFKKRVKEQVNAEMEKWLPL